MELFVGRQTELAGLDRVLAQAPPGVSVVELVGEPGIGKSRLLHEVAGRAPERGFAVLRGRSGEFERELPFGLFHDALEQHFPQEPVPGGLRGLHRAVSAALTSLSGPAGTALVLDDLHWTDEASVDLLAHLLRRPPAGRLVLLLAYRPRQLPDKLAAVLHEPWTQTHRVELTGLDFAAAEQIMPDLPSSHQRRERFAATGGNPLYLGIMGRTKGNHTGRGALLAEFGELSAPARLIAQAAAVLGDQVDPDLVAVAADLTPGQTQAAAGELFTADLLRAADAGPRVTFRHPLLRNAVYHSADPLWRCAAHGRVARELAGRGVPVAVLAPHLARSAALGDVRAREQLRTAARGALLVAPATAASWVRAAFELHPEPDDEVGRELRLELAQALAMSGRSDEARELARALLRDERLRLPATALYATTSLFSAWATEATEVLYGELRRQPAQDDDLLTAVAWQHVANLEAMRARFAEAAAAAEEVVRRRPAGVDCPVRCAGLAALALNYPQLGRTREAVRLMDEATAMYERISQADDRAVLAVGHLVPMTVPIAEVYGHLRLDGGLRRLRQTQAVMEGLGHLPVSVGMMTFIAVGESAAGQLAQAVATTEEAVDLARLVGTAPLLESALVVQGAVAFDCLDLDTLEQVYAEVCTLPGAGQNGRLQAVRLCLALLRRTSGRDSGLGQVIEEVGGPELPGVLYRSRLRMYAELAEAGEPGDWADRAEAVAEASLAWSVGFAALARAHTLHRSGAPEPALEHAEAAVHAFTAAGLRIQAGRAQVLSGLLHGALGRRTEALSELDGAAALFTACGADRHLNLVTRHQRKLGRRVPTPAPHTARHSPLGLTRREAEIAGLAAQGDSNRVIAERLVVSERTVETHLGRVYRKLGVNSRAALAARLAGGA
ncbi:DNA-binding CsgD family transcriptional regulator/tetratricopeptide (TPR) repeat protein [Crossiella equi]|uniref:DNA-binding CsgD family transcriptional regulator/tetratricopeptide (TPR) repeat protein n=1 Tax=Crossiella equi TaxID=130796 RepID=A0ABS5ASK9_9PSEU|nr:AAA family ATPase [Crossiella equi]MBP2479382.1 DNA-binding CsgD family transcriptional regulator/tetratricopeptide (TPR) repeat protein [Crossiella equi]